MEQGGPPNGDTNMVELLKLLEPQGNNAAKPQQPRPQPQPAPQNPQQVAAANNARIQQQIRAKAAMQQATQHSQQQIARQQLIRRQQQQAAAAAAVQQQRQSAVQVQQTNVAELEELLRNQSAPPTQQRRPISAPVAAPGAAVFPPANANAAEGNRNNANVQQRQHPQVRSNSTQPQRRNQVTQEQVIVGHFCRHALACLTKLTRDLPNHQQLQLSLKSDIKRLWAQWVDDRITKAALLETVARIVRNSCPAAANINVISEFRSWYHQQLDAQRNSRNRQNPPTNAVPAPRQAAPTAVPQQNQAQLANYRYTQQQRVAAPPRMHQQQQQALAMQRTTGVSPAVHRAAIAQGMSAIGAQQAKISVQGVPPKAEPKQYAAKSIPQKTVAAKTVPRNIPKTHQQQLNAQAVSAQNAVAYAAAQQHLKGRPAISRQKVMGPVAVKNEAVLAAAINNPQMVAGKRLAQPVNLVQYNTMQQMNVQKKVLPGTMAKKPSPKGKKGLPGTVQQIPATMLPKGHPHQARVGHPMPGVLTPGAVPALGQQQHMAQVRPGTVNVARPAVVVQGQAPVDQKKKKGIDMGLNVVDNIVDIDNEQNRLVGEVGQHDLLMHEVEDYSNTLLDGTVLKDKIMRAMQKYGLQGGVSKEIVEMFSLAARERLAYVIENVSEMAQSRVDTTKYSFETKDSGVDVYAELEKMRDDEERNLVVQSKLRTAKWRKSQEELSAREAAGKGTDEKSSKEAASQAEQKKKAKAAAEKKRAADSSQRFALTAAIGGINKRRKKKPQLKPLVVGSGNASTNGSAKGSMPSSGTQMATIPLGATTGTSVVTQARGPNAMAIAKPVMQRPPILLEDCLAFFQEEPNMRQSALVYKWYARLHAPWRRGTAKARLLRR